MTWNIRHSLALACSGVVVAGLVLSGCAGAVNADPPSRPAAAASADPTPLASVPPGESGDILAEGDEAGIPSDVTPEQAQAMDDQVPLFEFSAEAATISAALPDDPAVSTEFDTPNKTLILYWYGKVPDEVIALQEKATAQGYAITVLPSAHTRAQLWAGADQITDLAGSPVGLSVQLNNDGSGLTVLYPGLDGILASPDGSLTFEASEAVLRAIDVVRATGMPVDIGESYGEVATTF